MAEYILKIDNGESGSREVYISAKGLLDAVERHLQESAMLAKGVTITLEQKKPPKELKTMGGMDFK
jgi:hypothetical protein